MRGTGDAVSGRDCSCGQRKWRTKVLQDKWLVQVAARKAAELGADVVKTAYTGDPESFKAVIASTFIPVVILGGEKSDDRSVLQSVRDSLEAGGSGVAFGRNVWKHPNPSGMVRALVDSIHKNMGVEDALKEVA